MRSRSSTVSSAVILLIWIVLGAGAVHGEAAEPLCRGAGEQISALLKTRILEDFPAEADTVHEVVRELHDRFYIPLSFIENQAEEPMTPPTAGGTVEGVIAAIVERYENYRCAVVDDRLVLRSTDTLFDLKISDIDLVGRYRYSAMYDYIDHLRSSDPAFEAWRHPLVAMAGDGSPVFDGRVTLSPEGPLILHLVQLLGCDNRNLYFEVPAPSEFLPGRTIRFGAVKWPWERVPRPGLKRRLDDSGAAQHHSAN